MGLSERADKHGRRKTMKKTNRVRPYIHTFYYKNHLIFILAMLLQVMEVPWMLLVSWLLGAILDVIAAGDLGRLMELSLFFIGMTVFNTILNIVCSRVKASFVRRGLQQYKAYAFDMLSQKSISAFNKENTGRYISVLTNDVGSISGGYLENSFGLVAQSLSFISTLVMMCLYNPFLTLMAALLCLLPFAGALGFSKELARREKSVSDYGESFVERLKDLLTGFAVIKSFKAEKEAQKIFNNVNDQFEKEKLSRNYWGGLLNAVANNCGVLMQFGIFFIGAYLAIKGEITGGTVLVFVNLCNNLITPARTVPQSLAQRKAAWGLIEKLADIMEENTSGDGDVIQPKLNDAIELKNVSFAYEPEKPVLKNLSLRLEAGKKYAVVGASGSGKSTLINLLMGAYGNFEGSITIDGRELKGIHPDSLYDLMSLIGQNVFLFDDTIHNNITMFRDFPSDQVASAVNRAGLSALLAERGEEYRCGEGGVGLSGGERQRVSIARCLLRETPVLLVDEATAALDTQTAYAVTDAILHQDNLTRLVVTHWLEASLLVQYDEIFVLRNGRLCESGTFENLMERKGYFYSLYTVSNEECS